MFFIVASDIVSISIRPLIVAKTTDFELISKVQMILELSLVRDGYFTFHNFISFTISDAISFIDSLYWLSCACAYWLFVLRVRFHKYFS